MIDTRSSYEWLGEEQDPVALGGGGKSRQSEMERRGSLIDRNGSPSGVWYGLSRYLQSLKSLLRALKGQLVGDNHAPAAHRDRHPSPQLDIVISLIRCG